MTGTCNGFFKCINGEAMAFYCKPGHLYDTERELCDVEEKVSCSSERPLHIVDVNNPESSKMGHIVSVLNVGGGAGKLEMPQQEVEDVVEDNEENQKELSAEEIRKIMASVAHHLKVIADKKMSKGEEEMEDKLNAEEGKVL